MSDPERVIEADLFRATREPPYFGRLSWWAPLREQAMDFAVTPSKSRAARSGAVFGVRIQVPASQIADIRDDPQRGSGFDRLACDFGWNVGGWMAAQDPPWEPTAGLKLLRRHMAPLLYALAPDLAARGFRWLVFSSRYPLSTQTEWLRLTDDPPLQPVRVRGR